MPNKAHRAASRQAQVNRRKRRSKIRTQDFDPGPDEDSAPVATVAAPVIETDDDGVPLEQPVPARTAAAPTQRSRRRAAAESAPEQKFLAGELRQIGFMATAIAIVLAVLTVLLR